MPDVQESRRHRRVECKELKVGLYDDGRPMPQAALDNLSLGGMGVAVQDQVHEGQELEYCVQLPSGEIKGRAVVRWVQPYDLGYRGGVEFAPLGFWDKRRLSRYTGEGFKFSVPVGAGRFFDTLLFFGTAAVIGLIALDALNLNTSDLLDLAIFTIWL